MKNLISSITIILIILFLFSCKTSTEPENPEELIPYMTINIGDLRQYFETSSGVYFQWEVVDTLIRTDLQKIFKVEESYRVPGAGLFYATNYYFIKDNFFYNTRLDSSGNKSDTNKFIDYKLAKVFPKDGDYFLSTEGVSDSEQVHFKVNFIDSLNTKCGNFYNVAEYEKIEGGKVNQSIYYAPDYGHIGSTFKNEYGESSILATYIKTIKNEIGNYVNIHSQQAYSTELNKDFSKGSYVYNLFK